MLRRRLMKSDDGVFVDLGLPSGLLWAKGNIVKNGNKYKMGEETDYGAYFSWGNIVPHFSSNGSKFDDNYTWEEYTYTSTPGGSLGDNIASNDAAYDAALALLGTPCHMPTKEDFQELFDYTDNEWTTIDGVNGYKFMKKADHSVYIFLPAGGYGNGNSLSLRGSFGYYWSSSYYSSSRAYYCEGSTVKYRSNRCYGYSVRAVK